MSDTIEVKDWQ